MTLRMHFAGVAIAALAVIVVEVNAARALTFCNLYPERCRYSTSGRYYYYPHGHPMPEGLAPAFVERTSTGSAASGPAWGCAATEGTSRLPTSWGYPSRAAAAAGALDACKRGSTGGTCRIIGCSAGIKSRDEARAKFSSARR
jgi:hypothetical protein